MSHAPASIAPAEVSRPVHDVEAASTVLAGRWPGKPPRRCDPLANYWSRRGERAAGTGAAVP